MDWNRLIEQEYQKLLEARKLKTSQLYEENKDLVENGGSCSSQNVNCVWKVEHNDNDSSQLSRGNSIGTKHFTDDEVTLDVVRPHLLPMINSPPLMTSWVSLPANMPTQAFQENTSIPCLDISVNERFIEELAELQEEDGPEDVEINVFMDDEIFTKLVQALIPYQRNTNEASSSSQDNETLNLDAPDTIIFQKISAFVSGKPDTDYLREKYMKLTKSINESSYKPNIDEPMKEALTRDQALASYHKYFCRKCGIYGCPIHCHEPIDFVPKLRGNTEWLKPFDKPCTNACYLSQAERRHEPVSQSKNGRYKSSNDKATQKVTSDAETDWSGSEETLLLSLIKVFPDNFCAIAEVIGTKTCQETQKRFQLMGLQFIQRKKIKAGSRGYYHQDFEKVNRPCNHEGPCVEKNKERNKECECINCDKFCNCNIDCLLRTRMTCTCKASCATHSCICFHLKRECDLSVCGCGDSCKNVNIQKSRGKKLQVVTSSIHGWGVIVEEFCQKGDYITEYRGEIISTDEAKRREKVYDKMKNTFMFDLNSEYVVDAKHFGNKIRFDNHSTNPNCVPKILLVNGDHRIGIFAARFIEAGEELTIDYGSCAHVQQC